MSLSLGRPARTGDDKDKGEGNGNGVPTFACSAVPRAILSLSTSSANALWLRRIRGQDEDEGVKQPPSRGLPSGGWRAVGDAAQSTPVILPVLVEERWTRLG